MTTIETHHLSKRFDDVVAVEDLSFTARPGAVTGFLGPSGAGKTTTLKTLLGLLAPSAGRATFNGRAYAELAEPYRHVGAVLESTGFHPGRRARAHLRVLATAAGLPLPRVDEVLDDVGLTHAANKRIKDFSLGMRQRLALAAALLGDPDVLILDEPANGLDPEGVHWLRCFLRRFADRGGTVLVSSHLLAEVAQTVDDVVIIAHGRFVTQASLTELAERRPSEVRVRTPQAETLRSALSDQGILTDLLGPDTLVAFQTTAETVGVAAAGVGAAIHEMTTQHLDLEETFLELTNHEEAIR